jgi:flagellar assembly protein FliH
MPAAGTAATPAAPASAAPASPSTGQALSTRIQQDAPPPDAWASLRQREQALQEGEQALRARVAEQEERERRHAEAAEDLLSESRERGYREGQARARQELEAQRGQAASELARQAAEVEQVLDGLRSARADLLEQSGDMLVEIVHAAICRLLGEHGATRAAIEAVVQAALRDARDGEQLRVRVHPQDFDLLRSLYGGADSRIGLQSDMAVELGGCLVDTAHGTLDARLELQLQNLRKALMAARHARSGIEVAD